jgi:hypothetical protein
MAPERLFYPHYRCRFCGVVFGAWLPVEKRPERSLLLHHLSQSHPDQVGPYLAQTQQACYQGQ